MILYSTAFWDCLGLQTVPVLLLEVSGGGELVRKCVRCLHRARDCGKSVKLWKTKDVQWKLEYDFELLEQVFLSSSQVLSIMGENTEIKIVLNIIAIIQNQLICLFSLYESA